MFELCTQKFHEVFQCKQNNRKICKTKMSIKINCVDTIFMVIFFLQKIFPSDFFTLITIWRWKHFIDFRDQSRVTNGLFPNELTNDLFPNELVEKWRSHVALLSFLGLVWRFYEVFSSLWSFFFFVKPLFSCRVVILPIWNKSPHWRKSSLFIGKIMELNLKFSKI